MQTVYVSFFSFVTISLDIRHIIVACSISPIGHFFLFLLKNKN